MGALNSLTEQRKNQDFLLNRKTTFLGAMDMNAVKGLVAEKPVVIFSRSQCSMSYTVKTLISSFGANPTVYELDVIPDGHHIETLLLQLGCQPCVPAIFIGQKLIGGARELMSLQVRNELMPLLMSARAIWV